MSNQQLARMRQLPLLIRSTRSSRQQLLLAREFRALTEQYKAEREAATGRQTTPVHASA